MHKKMPLIFYAHQTGGFVSNPDKNPTLSITGADNSTPAPC